MRRFARAVPATGAAVRRAVLAVLRSLTDLVATSDAMAASGANVLATIPVGTAVRLATAVASADFTLTVRARLRVVGAVLNASTGRFALVGLAQAVSTASAAVQLAYTASLESIASPVSAASTTILQTTLTAFVLVRLAYAVAAALTAVRGAGVAILIQAGLALSVSAALAAILRARAARLAVRTGAVGAALPAILRTVSAGLPVCAVIVSAARTTILRARRAAFSR